jgi:hypothetical protein
LGEFGALPFDENEAVLERRGELEEREVWELNSTRNLADLAGPTVEESVSSLSSSSWVFFFFFSRVREKEEEGERRTPLLARPTLENRHPVRVLNHDRNTHTLQKSLALEPSRVGEISRHEGVALFVVIAVHVSNSLKRR